MYNNLLFIRVHQRTYRGFTSCSLVRHKTLPRHHYPRKRLLVRHGGLVGCVWAYINLPSPTSTIAPVNVHRRCILSLPSYVPANARTKDGNVPRSLRGRCNLLLILQTQRLYDLLSRHEEHPEALFSLYARPLTRFMATLMDFNEKKCATGSSASTDDHLPSPASSAHEHHQPDVEKQEQENHEDAEKNLNPLSTAVTTESVIPPPPDGGLHAWLKVFGGFFIYVNIWYA